MVYGSAVVALTASFSGWGSHGFKFCSVIGEVMADLALNGSTAYEIGLFRLHRFGS